jgi:hypothetical protein
MAIEYSNFNLTAGNAVRYWQLSDITSLRYDTADTPMAGEMDPFFFLSKHKNFIPHTYPCRDDFRQHFAEKNRSLSPAQTTLAGGSLLLPTGSTSPDFGFAQPASAPGPERCSIAHRRASIVFASPPAAARC